MTLQRMTFRGKSDQSILWIKNMAVETGQLQAWENKIWLIQLDKSNNAGQDQNINKGKC